MNKIILASKSEVRKKILNINGIYFDVVPSNIDEESIKITLVKSLTGRLKAPQACARGLGIKKIHKHI